jgi:hypothetical protein
MSPTPFITKAAHDCPDCEDKSMTEIVRAVAKRNWSDEEMSKFYEKRKATQVSLEDAQMNPSLDFPFISGSGGARTANRTRSDIIRDREARMKARICEQVDEHLKEEEAMKRKVGGDGKGVFNFVGSAKTEQDSLRGLGAKNSAAPSTLKASDILKGVYEKDAKYRLAQSETTMEKEKTENRANNERLRAVCGFPDRSANKTSLQSPKPNPAEEKSALRLEHSGNSYPRVPAPPLHLLQSNVTELKLKSERRNETARTSHISKGAFVFKNPDINAKLAQLRSDRETSLRKKEKETVLERQAKVEKMDLDGFSAVLTTPVQRSVMGGQSQGEKQGGAKSMSTLPSATSPVQQTPTLAAPSKPHSPAKTTETENPPVNKINDSKLELVLRTARPRPTESSPSLSSTISNNKKSNEVESVKDKEDEWEDIAINHSEEAKDEQDGEWEIVDF